DPDLHEIVIVNHCIWSFRSVGNNQILANDGYRGYSAANPGRGKERVMSSYAMTTIDQKDTVPPGASTFHPDVGMSECDGGLSAFVAVRSRLFGIAYHMLRNAAEAEDIVQDAWLRWQSADRNAVENPTAFLATTTTRLCINLAQSAHTRRETYIGTWLPEIEDTGSDPTVGTERDEALKLAIMLLLEKLSPTERAAYVLREAFDYPYRQIAKILQMAEANVRQLVSRARKHMADGRRTPVGANEQRRFLEAFIAAAQHGDMASLESFLGEVVISSSDGGAIVGRDGFRFFAATA
ncbi:MAG TPA: sigma-70 family RNA polymerase sigma factor, partial [Terriglobales bacterium]|nr:sigma-70 family RNA polymerase sigma factor [Terriglobales bacterium]